MLVVDLFRPVGKVVLKTNKKRAFSADFVFKLAFFRKGFTKQVLGRDIITS